MNINKVFDITLNEINININELENKIKNMNINNQQSYQLGHKLFKIFDSKFIGDKDYLINRIKRINSIKSIYSIIVKKNKLILIKDKTEITFYLMDEKGYINNTYHKQDYIIFVFNFENNKNYDYIKLCCKYYIKNYNL